MQMNDKPKILAVDDNPKGILSIKAALEGLSADIISANSGNQALSLLMDNNFSLIMLDVQMPNMNGFEVAELIRGVKKYENIPIIFVTAFSRERTEIFKGYEVGAVDYLFKPLDLEMVRAKVNVFLEMETQKEKLEKEVNARRQAEMELRRLAENLQEANNALEEFAYMVSHDLKTPLVVINGFSQLLSRKYKHILNEEGASFIERISSSAARMDALIEKLLQYGRTSSRMGTIASVDLENIAKQIADDFSYVLSRTGGQIEICCLPTIKGDEIQLRQLFQNLIGNSIKYRRPDEPVKIKVFSERTQDNLWRIIVQDNGRGLEKDKLTDIFTPFYRVENNDKTEGSGIGLAICKKVCERHGGSITVESEPGKGSKFIVTLGDEPPALPDQSQQPKTNKF